MKKEQFRKWLEEKYFDSLTTVANRLANCSNVEKYYGDLEDSYEKDKCRSIIKKLEYSVKDERENKKQKHIIPINGNIRTGSATLKQAVKLYISFKEEEIDELITFSVQDNEKHDVLIEMIKGFYYDKKNHTDITILQNDLAFFLNENYGSFLWEIEHRITEEFKDSIDIIGTSKEHNYVHVIELDTHRADQVSKKFVSRMALLEKEEVCYTAICYPGTKNMSKNETLKYFNYCQVISKNLLKQKSFRGIIL